MTSPMISPMSNAPVPNALANALPRRPIVVRLPPPTSPLTVVGLFALLLGMLGGILWWLGPDLVRDWRLRGEAVAADGARIEEARCQAWLQVFRFCSVTVADQRDGADAKRTLWYAFIGAADGQSIELRRSRSAPFQLTTNVGLDNLFGRSITLVLFCAILLFCIGAAAVVLSNAWLTRHVFAAMSGQRLTAVIVEIERSNLVPPRRRMWAYLYDGAAGQERAVVEWPARDRPLFTSGEERWAVALRGEEAGAPLLLDAGLACLDLTDAERAAFHDACHAAFAGLATRDSA